MTQDALPLKYERERTTTGMTGLAGLGPILDLTRDRLRDAFHVHAVGNKGGQGYTAGRMGMALALLNLAGGTTVDDLDKPEAVEGFSEVSVT